MTHAEDAIERIAGFVESPRYDFENGHHADLATTVQDVVTDLAHYYLAGWKEGDPTFTDVVNRAIRMAGDEVTDDRNHADVSVPETGP